MPVQIIEQEGLNPLAISEYREDNNAVLAAESSYLKGSILGKDVDGNYELTTTAVKADAILLDDVDTTNGVLNAPILIAGAVDSKQLILGGSLTIDDVKDILRDKNIYLK